MNGHREAQTVFKAAIEAGILSAEGGRENYAGKFMYMGDNEQGRALFKNIDTRAYLPAAEV